MTTTTERRRLELNGFENAIRPLSNKLTELASDYDVHAKAYGHANGTHDAMLANEMRRAAAQLRAVRGLMHERAISPREAGVWASAAIKHLAEIRRAG